MRKTLTLLLALSLGSAIGWSATTYRVGTSGVTSPTKGLILSDNNAPVKVSLESNASFRHTATHDILPDGEKISTYGSQSISIRQSDDNSTRIKLEVNQTINDVYIYFTGADGSWRNVYLESSNNQISTDSYSERTPYHTNSSGSTEYAYISTVSRLSSGTYYISTKGFSGGFVGLKYTVTSNASRPTNPTQGVSPTSDDTVWDFNDVSGNGNVQNEPDTYKSTDASDYYSYAWLYNRNYLSYKETFKGELIAFKGEYPIRKGQYAQNGTLYFYAESDGAIRVTFSDTGTSANADPASAHKRYLVINDERTNYWTSREYTGEGAYPAQLNVTTGLIPVKAGYVYINGTADNDELSGSITVSRVEYIKYNEDKEPGNIVAVTSDTFSQRTFSWDDKLNSVSTWSYGGYKHNTHGLVGGVDDNGIIYYSSEFKGNDTAADDDNTNGNITFYAPSADNPNYWLSCSFGSTIYVPVMHSDGTITITCTQDDYTGNSAGDRYFELYKEGSNNPRGILPLQKTSSLTFTKDDISTYNGGEYLKLVSHFDENYWKSYKGEYAYKGEMKVYTISVALSEVAYTPQEVETDYDHEILGNHRHAIFNWTQGDVYTEGYHYGTLTLSDGSLLIGEDPEGSGTKSETETIHSYRNGDLVKYKTNYYGSLQFLSNVDYTIKAPRGYYITTSVRVHGYNNKNKSKTDDDTNIFEDAYVSAFNNGVFTNEDNTFMKFPRDDSNARTTTLDFTVPASESILFNFSDGQVLGVVDAVLVRQEVVPTIGSKVFFVPKGSDEAKDLSMEDTHNSLGKIYYKPASENEELWWYFHPKNAPANPRGNWEYINSADDSLYPADSEGVKDQNITKKFSVRNYKFVRAIGHFSTNELKGINDVYDTESNYKSTETTPQNLVMPLADSDYDSYPITLDIDESGTFYFYIKDTSTNLNSLLAISSFDFPTGIENVEIDNALDGAIYNIYGQKVDKTYRGLVIKNGQKYFQR